MEPVFFAVESIYHKYSILQLFNTLEQIRLPLLGSKKVHNNNPNQPDQYHPREKNQYLEKVFSRHVGSIAYNSTFLD